jgi:ParB family chromosome partitioning protein
MQLEFHQLDRRWEHMRVRHPARQRRLLASLAEAGQQTPIVVVAGGQADRYVVIDGYKRIVALEQLGRDTVEAVVWPMSEAAAVAAGPFAALVGTRDRAGGGLVLGGVGTALQL